MIHVENITINIQPPGAESSPTNALGDALMKAMAESLFAEQTEEVLDEEAHPPISPARMSSMQQQADAWKVVCATLDEVCPGWCTSAGSATYQAAAAIHAMTKVR